ncbi:SigE family RNA polymerase sigma factor [Actinoalloteichus hymeniacidonis]|uniref:RNA polymerase sigma factor, sigma-70 family n=1 Tax=Actinoalloteichus hymeniacidonis TaxID=340345 RepID=A0AAC9MXD0_9PSEU|nr:SigE family RNA polymerase sigma factor [Actinoalloteichus hymeniacidonis]AOS61772.1 RNA polymerase sigma factor, sigma-70 family [Actinoalloteichus hymeniacidonis]MBB5910210.1 RNA polymerase sigma-70 factor (sigma-E family) [Actinoalloteichus hymeniacidonis]
MTFDDFVTTRLGDLLRYATVLSCDPHLAQDIVQEVLLRAQGRWRRIENLDSPLHYVRRMVTNEYLSWRRRRTTRDVSVPPETLGGLAGAGQDPISAYDERDAMLTRIASLPPRQRAALVLRYYEGLPHAEIASIMRCSEGTARSNISRALSTLRGETRSKDIVSAGSLGKEW